MKVIEFIKKNISVLNVVAFILLFFILKYCFFYKSFNDGYGLGKLFIFIQLLFVIILLFIDLSMKTYIKNRFFLNIFQLIILIFTTIYFKINHII